MRAIFHETISDSLKAAHNAGKKPRVLLVGPGLSGGGAENRFRLTAKYLFGGNTSVAVFKRNGLEEIGAPSSVLHLGWSGSLSHATMVLRLRRHLCRHHFDAVLAFGFYPNLISWAAVQGLRRRPALVLTEVNSPHQESLEIKGTIRRPIMDAVRRLIYPRADHYAANSDDGVSDVVRYYGVDPERARRVPNFVEPERLKQLADDSGLSDQPGNTLSICIVGRLFRRKRVDTLLQAAAGLPDEPPWRIDVVGDGEDRAALKALAHDLGIAERVRFHGWLKNPYPVISRSTVSVLCSEFEGFSNSVLEAMVLGIPVISSLCTSDARDMCAQGAALGFPVGDHLGLRACLARVLESQTLGEDLRTKAWAYAQRHTIPVAINEYETLILDAIERHRMRR